jgi:Cu/Ag efflux protein CusF
MEQWDKEHKKSYKVNGRPILSLLIGLGFISVILLVTMLVAAEEVGPSRNANKKTDQEELEATTTSSDSEVLGIVKKIDTDRKLITIYDIDSKETAAFTYSGGTNITDKYNQVIAISQIPIGTMVEGSFEKVNGKLTAMSISTKAWEYIGVSNLNINRSAQTMKIATTRYKFTKDIVILDGQEFITVDNLAEQDELTIRGYDETIWSITVTRGHGTVKLADYEMFLGAGITVGYEAMQQITKDMTITVREGNFNLTVENGKYSATKNITVNRNQETLVSLGDLGPEALKQSRITFEITPFGADLYIDGEITSYANPLELTYGEHTVKVALGGYTTFSGVLNVNVAGKTIKIDLPEVTSNEEAVVSETDTQPNDNANNGNEDGTDTGTDAGTNAGSEQTENPVGIITDEDAIIDEKHSIYVQNPIGASVYINGDFMGTSPCNFQKIIGTHVITFIEDGYETMSYTVDVLNDGLNTYLNMPDLVRK